MEGLIVGLGAGDYGNGEGRTSISENNLWELNKGQEKDVTAEENPVEYFDNFEDFPRPGEEKKLYVDNSKGVVYIWSNTLADYKEEGRTQIQSDWEEFDTTSPAYIRRKPDFSSRAFISKWSVTANQTVLLPISGRHSVVVDWGDGVTNKEISHTYATEGVYDIAIKGTIENFKFQDEPTSKDSILEIVQWGDIEWVNINFRECFNLTTLPSIDYPNLTKCTSLNQFFIRVPLTSLPADLLTTAQNVVDMESAFNGVAISEIPAGFLDNCINVINAAYLFTAVSELTAIPPNLFKNNSQITSLRVAFQETSVTVIPDSLFSGAINLRDVTAAFRNALVTAIPEGLFDDNKYVEKVGQMFYSCPLVTIPEDFCAGVFDVVNFRQCFKQGEESPITGKAPELWIRFPKADGFECFHGQTALTNYDEIPTDWKDAGVTTGPDLGKEPIADRAYWDTLTAQPVWRIEGAWKTIKGSAVAYTGFESELDLSNPLGSIYHYATPANYATYSFVNPVINGFARNFITFTQQILDFLDSDSSYGGYPKVTGATRLKSPVLVANTVYEMVVESPDGINVEYYFIER